jgi:hypothetical protein
MPTEPGPRDPLESAGRAEAILADLKAVLEDGDPERIAPALNDAARAKNLARDTLTAQSDIASVIGTVKALGLELTVKRR